MMTARALVVFARAPTLGQVKTRLAAVVGDEAALALYTAFLDDTLAAAGVVARDFGALFELAVAGDAAHPALVALAVVHEAVLRAQADGDLGARMGAFIDRHVVEEIAPCASSALDSPCSFRPRRSAFRGFDALATHEVALGPSSTDGGYWLASARGVAFLSSSPTCRGLRRRCSPPRARGSAGTASHALLDTRPSTTTSRKICDPFARVTWPARPCRRRTGDPPGARPARLVIASSAHGRAADPLARFAQQFTAGTVLFREGDHGDKMYVVQSGRVRLTRRLRGEPQLLAVLPPGEFFGEMAIVNNRLRSATAEVIEDAQLLVLDSPHVRSARARQRGDRAALH